MKKLHPLAVATLLALGTGGALAGETIELGDGVKLDWRLNLNYGLATRLNDPSPVLAGSDGNNNFKKGSLTTNRLGALLESRLSKGDSGLVMTASTFYDDVYHHRNDNQGPIST
ncbi:MAG: DUF1302 family protein, partial [Comamonas sp.]